MNNYVFELIDILNQKALFTKERLNPHNFPHSFHLYGVNTDYEGNYTTITPYEYGKHNNVLVTAEPLNWVAVNQFISHKDLFLEYKGDNITLDDYIQMYSTRDSNDIMMLRTHELMIKNGAYEKAAKIMDEFSLEPWNLEKLTDYRFDFCAVPKLIVDDCIYLECYIKGIFTDQHVKRTLDCGTYKTKRHNLEAMQIMGELAGSLIYFNNQYVNSNLKRFTPDKELQAQAEQKKQAEEKNNVIKIKIRSIEDIQAELDSERENYRIFLKNNPGTDNLYQKNRIEALQNELYEKVVNRVIPPEESEEAESNNNLSM